MVNPGNLDVQTYGFGGGTNAASQVIRPGGFDPFVGVFAGTGPGAVFLDGTADNESNYGWPAAAGNTEPNPCGLANTVFIDATEGNQCGDVALEFENGSGFIDGSLPAGTYTVILSDADYFPSAATDPSVTTLGGGFTDYTAGATTFSSCYNDGTCIADNGNWAVDFAVEEGGSVVEESTPEPGSLTLTGLGLLAAGWALRRPEDPGLSQETCRPNRREKCSHRVNVCFKLAPCYAALRSWEHLTPGTLHAVAATLVEVTNTMGNPVLTLPLKDAASQQVLLTNQSGLITPGTTAPLSQVSPTQGPLDNLYAVPAGQNLVVTGVDVICPAAPMAPSSWNTGTTPPAPSPFEFYSGGVQGLQSYNYPNGLVVPAGMNLIIDNTDGTSDLFLVNVRGYLTPQ